MYQPAIRHTNDVHGSKASYQRSVGKRATEISGDFITQTRVSDTPDDMKDNSAINT
jgi:hypothetical protein